MDEKTAALREIFLDTTGSETVTEGQAESPGTLTGEDEDAVLDRLRTLVETMQNRYEFETDFETDQLVTLVRCFFDAVDDETMAEHFDRTPEEVFQARMALHLVRDSDRDGPIDFPKLKQLHVEDVPMPELIEELDADEGTVRRYTAVANAELESTRANNRFRDEFRELLTDSDLEGSLTSEASEDGLADATEDLETDVSF